MHLVDRLSRLAEIFERCLTDDQIERAFVKGHVGCIAPLKIHVHPYLSGVLSGDFYKGVTDIQPRYVKPVESCHLDCKITRTGCYLEHSRTFWQAIGEISSLLSPILDLTPGATNLRIPARDDSLHPH